MARFGGSAWVVSSLLLLSLAGCGSPPTPGDDAGGDASAAACTGDPDCDDGRFCNGAETCMPTAPSADARGCVHTESCLPSQQCSETERRCVTSCAVTPDADGDGEDALECGGIDCDDTDAMRVPGNTEVCDPGNRDEDCNPSTFGALDADGDTFVAAECCNVDGTRMNCGNDCNDTRRDSHPGATEACEHIDNDCDGAVDELLTVEAWPDLDYDLHGDETVIAGTDQCPGTPGWSTTHDDCDDASPIKHRAQVEICDLIDNDCDTRVDEAPVEVAWYPDEDGDGFGIPGASFMISCTPVPNYSTRSSDCNDMDAMVHPGAHEDCNGADDDCNGYADAGGLRAGDTEDDDGDQIPDVVCGGSDCDDAAAAVNPGAQEICDGIDNDCDTIVDGASADALWYLDLDRDGYGDMTDTPIMSCEPQPARVPRGGDCDDGRAAVHPGVPDFCDGIDDDCDDSFDESGIRFAFFPDTDGDGWGTTDRTGVLFRCAAPEGTSILSGDCADTQVTRFPGALETCDGFDEDCDMLIDEESERDWFPDGDMDGHGAGTPILACATLVPGHSPLSDDCDDLNAGNFPGNTELCNGRDDDCDTMVDDGAGMQCGDYPHTGAATACTAGVCVLACDSGYADCDGVLTDGCETDARRSPTYCGSCTNTCRPADTCGLTTPGVCDSSPVIALSGAFDGMMALRATGGVAAWGSAGFGQTTSGTDAPIPFATSLSGIAQLDMGEGGHTCALTAGRRVLCWGNGNQGQLGDGAGGTRTAPLEIASLPDAVQVSTGALHSCAVLTTGEVMCWGYNINGQLGDGTISRRLVPTLVPGITDAVEVDAGRGHTCARRGSPGSYYVSCWGQNDFGELGTGVVGGADRLSPVMVAALPGNLASFAHGATGVSVYVLTTDGLGYGWGFNANGDLGLGPTAPGSTGLPTLNTALSGVVEVSLEASRGCARIRGAAAGTFEVWCWGLQGSTGPFWIDGTTTTYAQTFPIPAAPVGARITDAISISTGLSRWCAARATGGVVCMGGDVHGALGNDATIATQNTPRPVANLP